MNPLFYYWHHWSIGHHCIHWTFALVPGVLSRPWCLLEIATAVRAHVNLMPMLIEKPGSVGLIGPHWTQHFGRMSASVLHFR